VGRALGPVLGRAVAEVHPQSTPAHLAQLPRIAAEARAGQAERAPPAGVSVRLPEPIGKGSPPNNPARSSAAHLGVSGMKRPSCWPAGPKSSDHTLRRVAEACQVEPVGVEHEGRACHGAGTAAACRGRRARRDGPALGLWRAAC